MDSRRNSNGETPYISANTLATLPEYGLHHVTNIWRDTELGFNADETYYTSMIGKTVTKITYYTANGVYVLPVNVAIPALAD